MDEPWWAIAMKAVLTPVLVALAVGWVVRDRDKAPAVIADSVVMKRPRAEVIVNTVVFVFFAALAWLSSRGPATPLAATLLLALFSGAAGWQALSASRFRAVFDSEGLLVKPFLRSARACRWADVTKVRWRLLTDRLDLTTRQGQVVRVPLQVRGGIDLAQVLVLLEWVEMNKRTRELLEEAADGRLPAPTI